MPIAKKPDLGAKKIDKIIKKGGSTTLEKFEKDVTNMSLKLSPQLNSTIESLQKNQFGMKRTKKQWIMEAIFAKIKAETGKDYKEV